MLAHQHFCPGTFAHDQGLHYELVLQLRDLEFALLLGQVIGVDGDGVR